jgi:hypothetical protein
MYSYLQKYYHGSDINESVNISTWEVSWDCLLRSSVLVFLSKMFIKYETCKFVERLVVPFKEQV